MGSRHGEAPPQLYCVAAGSLTRPCHHAHTWPLPGCARSCVTHVWGSTGRCQGGSTPPASTRCPSRANGAYDRVVPRVCRRLWVVYRQGTLCTLLTGAWLHVAQPATAYEATHQPVLEFITAHRVCALWHGDMRARACVCVLCSPPLVSGSCAGCCTRTCSGNSVRPTASRISDTPRVVLPGRGFLNSVQADTARVAGTLLHTVPDCVLAVEATLRCPCRATS